MKTIHVLAFAGSLREGSYNRATLKAAQELLPTGMELELFDLKEIPVYDGDVEKQRFPSRVQEFREAITAADALLIATPEYNKGVPGVLKNALDWGSRKAGQPKSPLMDKPMAMMGASDGGFGTSRAQRELMGLATVLGMHVYNGGAQVYISNADKKFTPDGVLLDQEIKQQITALLLGLHAWTVRLTR